MVCTGKLWGLVAASLVGATGLTTDAFAQGKSVQGKISRFECADNCYLSIVDRKNSEIVGLCLARECVPWINVGEMPDKFKGKRVSVTLGRGPQLDGNGDIVGRTTSFQRIEFLD